MFKRWWPYLNKQTGEVSIGGAFILLVVLLIGMSVAMPLIFQGTKDMNLNEALYDIAQGAAAMPGDLNMNGYDINNVGLIDAPTGRSATLTVAANGATALEKAQADYVCDGTADDVQIQAALDALTSGGKVSLSKGTFNISAPLVIPVSFITLAGQGWSTGLRAVDNLNDAIIEVETSVARYGGIVEDLRVLGNGSNQTSGIGIDWSGMQHGMIRRVQVYQCADDGIFADTSAFPGYSNVIRDCYIEGNGIQSATATGGIRLRNMYGYKIIDCPYIGNNLNHGIIMVSCGESIIQNCSIDQNTKNGIWLYSAYRVLVSDCFYLGDNNMDGIRIEGSSADVMISNCGILENGQANAMAGIRIYSTVARVGIQGCEIYGNTVVSGNKQSYHIYMEAEASDINIVGNFFRNDALTATIYDGGAINVHFADNHGYIAPGEQCTYAVPITAGVEDTTTYWQNPFPQNVWVTEVKFNLTAAASATNPTYDIKLDTDGSGVPDGTAFLDGVPDTAGTYWSYSNTYGGAASGVQTGYIQLASNASTSDWIGFCIEDAAGADSAGVIYITIMGQ